MNISLKKTDKKFAFKGSNGESEFDICASPKLEVGNSGFRPMELLLVSLGGCMSIDVLSILDKQKQVVDNYEVELTAEREDAIPAIFKTIHMHIIIDGEIAEKKLQRAIDLGVEKYCSVYKILSPTADIQIKYSLNNEKA